MSYREGWRMNQIDRNFEKKELLLEAKMIKREAKCKAAWEQHNTNCHQDDMISYYDFRSEFFLKYKNKIVHNS
jgi:hypothetical protein